MSRLRVIVVGLGVQGQKRRAVAGDDVVATVDPVHPEANFKSLQDVPLSSYDAALLCVPDEPKIALITYLAENRKSLLVEKPLLGTSARSGAELAALAKLVRESGITCYTAYNHRFEPHFVRMHELIRSGELGEIYSLRMFYGNGTARLVRNSEWRDRHAGVLPDLGSHLLDTLQFWLGDIRSEFVLWSASCFENLAFDHVTFGASGRPLLQCEITLLSWRNHFYADVFAERGSAHISSLCKWGPSTFTVRRRVLPSGRPPEENITLVQADPTWTLEYEHFKSLCRTGGSNISNDLWISGVLEKLAQAGGVSP
ncbi:MAG TPA: Gfo/Idh/MocA family oxidoreductase [Pseudolabrys sp.]|nr:Gfo/Idh/MocA family oxidoreductase [Pseudolabrys sp.]